MSGQRWKLHHTSFGFAGSDSRIRTRSRHSAAPDDKYTGQLAKQHVTVYEVVVGAEDATVRFTLGLDTVNQVQAHTWQEQDVRKSVLTMCSGQNPP